MDAANEAEDDFAEPYDGNFRYLVPSRRRGPKVKYLVDLKSYKANGECQCENFRFKLEPILRRGFTPAEAVAMKLIRIKDGKQIADALRCEHLIRRRSLLLDQILQASP